MRSSYSWWVTGIITLTVLAFLIVFKPITFSPRKDPSDVNLYLRPVGVSGKFDAERPPEKTLSFLSLNIFVYKPQHDLRLGLDLRGGMRVVLEIPDPRAVPPLRCSIRNRIYLSKRNPRSRRR